MLTVQALLEEIDLPIQVITGQEGLQRIISWAHTFETSEPWKWIQPGDLMMTTGLNLPKLPAEQHRWVVQLAKSGITALLIENLNDQLHISSQLLDAAESYSIPVLVTVQEIQFNAISHTVVESALRTRWERAETAQRLFSSYTNYLSRGFSHKDRLHMLCRILSAEVEILHTETHESIATYSSNLKQESGDAWREVEISPTEFERLHIRSKRAELLGDADFMWHWTTLMSLELGFIRSQHNEKRQRSEVFFHELLEGTLSDSTLGALLPGLDTRNEMTVIALGSSADSLHHIQKIFDHIQFIPPLRHIQYMVLQRDAILYLAAHRSEVGEIVRSVTQHYELTVGLSQPVSASNPFRQAADQARRSLDFALETGTTTVDFDSYSRQRLGAELVEHNKMLIQTTLQPLLDQDNTRGSDLIATLRMFLANDLSHVHTAKQLRVHRQTLAYRLKTITQLTGIDPQTTTGIVRFHNALNALAEQEAA